MRDEREQVTEQEFLTAKQAAKLLGLSSSWSIYAYRRTGRLIGYSIAGRNSFRFLKTDILGLLEVAAYVPRRPRAAGA